MSPSEPIPQGESIPFDANPVGDEPQTETEGTGTTEPQAPTGEKQPPPEPPADPVADAVNRITESGLSDRRFIARVRQVELPVAEHPHFTATVDRELRLRLLARLEDAAFG